MTLSTLPLVRAAGTRNAVALALALVCCAWASAAKAQTTFVSSTAPRYRSPKHWAMELRMGPYRPDIDSEFGDLPAEQRPHQLYFGNKRRLLSQIELDYQLWNGFGSLGIGAQVGYFRETAKAFVTPEGGSAPTVRSGDNTRLMLVPTSLSVVYRFDVPAVRLGIPLVPYAKAGIDWVYWSVANGNGDVTSDKATNSKGRGDATGFHGAVGLSLLLDIFDPGASQEFDAETGVNHTYLFFELAHYEINGLGTKDQPHLGDTTWSAGFMFEF